MRDLQGFASYSSIPIFPLSIVQFPGVITTLHIFEQRYRKLLKDILPSTKTFGIVYVAEGEIEQPMVGQIGCSVEILAHEELPDGRSNILCVGNDRFTVTSLIEGEPYYQAQVEYFGDDLAEGKIQAYSNRLKISFEKIIEAGNKLRDIPPGRDDAFPELPDDPVALSFLVAASIDADTDFKQRCLKITNTIQRIKILQVELNKLQELYELRARIHKIARANGHGPNTPDLN